MAACRIGHFRSGPSRSDGSLFETPRFSGDYEFFLPLAKTRGWGAVAECTCPLSLSRRRLRNHSQNTFWKEQHV